MADIPMMLVMWVLVIVVTAQGWVIWFLASRLDRVERRLRDMPSAFVRRPEKRFLEMGGT